MGFLNYYYNSYHRILLEKQLHKYKHLIKGNILDIGSKTRRYDHLFQGNVTAIDINPKPKQNIVKGNLINLEFDNNHFDSIICIEVFEFLEPNNFKKGLNEILRVLKVNGNSIITFPFFMIDGKDNIRLTYGYVLNYLSQYKNVKFQILKLGNKYTSLYDVIRYSLIQKRPNIIKGFLLILCLFLLYVIIKILSLEDSVDRFYSGYFLFLSKI